MGAQKNRLIETVLLRTHNIYFGCEIRKIVFNDTLLSEGLIKLIVLILPKPKKRFDFLSAGGGELKFTLAKQFVPRSIS